MVALAPSVEAGARLSPSLIATTTKPTPTQSLAESAAAHGRLDVLETFPSTTKSGGIAVTSAAASHGHLPCLKFAVERLECDVDERALSTAAAWGHKECVRYLVAARCPGWDAYDEAWSPGSPQW